MPLVFTTVTKAEPCNICGEPDWCQVGDRAYLCMRVQSDHPANCGGWYHPIVGAASASLRPLPKKRPSGSVNCVQLINAWLGDTDRWNKLDVLAINLGVSTLSLSRLNTCWAPQYNAWAFPMRDGNGGSVGIRLRNSQGKKWTVKDTHPGLFLDNADNAPLSWKGETAFICEGPTDTAACFNLGLHALGKPSCNFGNDYIVETLKRVRPRDVVILADRDDKINKTTGRPSNIGLIEAHKLKDMLNFKTLIVPPPMGFKDIREFVQNGGTKSLLESLIKQYTWL